MMLGPILCYSMLCLYGGRIMEANQMQNAGPDNVLQHAVSYVICYDRLLTGFIDGASNHNV